MLLTVHQPLHVLTVPVSRRDGRCWTTLVARAEFVIGDRGELRAIPEPRLCLADRFFADPCLSSLREAGDLSPFKPRTDVYFKNAIAHAPDGMPAASWGVSLQVGRMEPLRLRVTGERSFTAPGTMTDPELATEVPLLYEFASGGSSERERRSDNPVGRGVWDDPRWSGDAPRPAPRIEWDDATSRGPAGVGPIARAWQPRLGRIGTTSEEWLRTRFPDPPADFDDGFYNCANPMLTAPGYLRGDESVRTRGLLPEGDWNFNLPGVACWFLTTRDRTDRRALRGNLDTVVIDPHARTLGLVWRAILPGDGPLEEVRVMTQGLEAHEDGA